MSMRNVRTSRSVNIGQTRRRETDIGRTDIFVFDDKSISAKVRTLKMIKRMNE